MASPRRAARKQEEENIAQKALADAAAAAAFVFLFSFCGPLSDHAAPYLGLSPAGAGLAIVLGLLIAMGPLCQRLGGALYNPANNAMLYAVGKGGAREHLVRSVAQAAGSAAGAWLAIQLLPPAWAKHLPALALGLRPGAGLLDGAASEFVLGALLAFVVLLSEELPSSVLKLWTPLLATVLAVKAGEHLSGPSLNPAVTFGWSFLHPGSQTAAEHLLVYWLAPMAAGLFGGWAHLGWQQFAAQRGWRAAPAAAAQQRRRAKAD